MFQKCPFADGIARKLEISIQMSNLPGKLLLWLINNSVQVAYIPIGTDYVFKLKN